MPTYPDSIARSLAEKVGEYPSVKDFGAVGNGTANDAPKFQDAIDSVTGLGGGMLFVPRGEYNLEAQVELKSGVTLYGEGAASVLLRGATLGAGEALLSVIGDDAGIVDLLIDGQVTTPVVLKYSDFSLNPMDAQLTGDSSVWLRPGQSRFAMRGVTIRHTGGYAVMIDADTADVRNVTITGCTFEQNRPHIFETEDDLFQFGSWTGGIFYRGDCRTSASKPFAVHDLLVTGCRFRRCTGNQVWGHSWGFDVQHRGVIVEGCSFETIGRDGILFGNVEGGAAKANEFRFFGYLTSTDSDTPAAVAGGDPSVAIDTSGYCSGVEYSGNSVSDSPDAEAFDLDGFRDGSVSNNRVIGCYIGVNMGDSQNNGAGRRVTIAGNIFDDCQYTSLRLNDAEDCVVTGNTISQPSTTTEAPIMLHALTANGCRNNLITNNRIAWGKDDWCVKEATAGGSFSSACENRVFGNHLSGANRGEFVKHEDSASLTAYILSSADSTATSPSESIIERLGFDTGAALRLATRIAGVRTEVAQFQDANRMLLVGLVAGKGAIATGDRAALIWGDDSDAMATGKVYADGFMAFAGVGLTEVGYQSTFDDLQADAIATDEVGLLRYNAVDKRFEQSIAVLSGARVWTTFGGGSPGGSTTQVQFNSSGSFGGSNKLTWDGSTLRAIGQTGFAQIQVQTGSGQAANHALAVWNPTLSDYVFYVTKEGDLYGGTFRCNTAVPAFSDSVFGYYAADGIRFKQTVGDFLNAGTIRYRAGSPSNTLNIYGAGTTYGDLLVSLHNRLNIWGAAGAACITLTSGYIDSAEGFVTASALTNAIQAPSGGVTAKYIIATTSFSMIAETSANAGLSTSGNGRIYFDSSLGKFRASQNGGAYVDLVGSGSVAGSNGHVQFNSSGSFGADSGFSWDNSGKKLILISTANTVPGLSITTGYAEAAGGFVTTSALTNAIQAPSGGVTAKYAVLTTSFSMIGDTAANAGLSTSGNGRFYFDSTTGRFRVSEGGGAYVNLLDGNISGLTTGRVPFAASATSLTDTSNLSWDNSAKKLIIVSTGSGIAGLSITTGYAEAAGGFVTTATLTNAIQAPVGGVTAKYLIGTTSLTMIAETAVNAGLSTGGNGRIYFDSSSGKYRVSENGGAYVDLVGSGGISGLTSPRVPFAASSSTLTDSANLSWDNSLKRLVLFSTANTAQALVISTGYAEIAGGLNVTAATNYNSIQTAGGIRLSPRSSGKQKIYVGFSPLFDPISAPTGIYGKENSQALIQIQGDGDQASFQCDAYGAAGVVPALIGRKANGTVASPSAVVDQDTLLVFGGRGWFSGGSDFPSALNAAITFQAAGTFFSTSQPTRILLATTDSGQTARVTRMTINASGTVDITGVASTAALVLTNGYIYSNEGYYSPSVADAAVNIPSGGVWANKLITKQACYMLTFGTGATPNNPGASYAGLGHRSGSTYWYWNGFGWNSVDFAGSGGSGVTSINSQIGPSITILGTTNEIEVSSGSNTVTVGLPNNVLITSQLQVNGASGAAIYAPNAYIQGRGLLSTGLLAWNSIQSDAGVAANISYGFSLIGPAASYTQYPAIDFSGSGARFVGLGGVNCGQFGGIAGAGFNPNVSGTQYTGYSSDSFFGGGDVLVFSATVSGVPRTISARFTRGALTFYSAV